MKYMLTAITFACFALAVSSQEELQPPGKRTFETGHVPRPDLPALVDKSIKRHGRLLAALPKVTAGFFDCREIGLVPPVVDQGNCGSCWNFAGTSVITSAFIKAGWGKADGSFTLSEQYTMDCYRNGGCDGDDYVTVLEHARKTGLPTTKDYGPYTAREGRCKPNVQTHKIQEWGFCSPTNPDGLASVQDIKNAMVKYGPIGSAIAADNAFMNARAGQVFKGNSRQINHQVVLVGWDDLRGAWILRNSWGASWCDKGYCWIAYGANGVGTEAVWCLTLPIDLPPTPLPPDPPKGPTITTVTLKYLDGSTVDLEVIRPAPKKMKREEPMPEATEQGCQQCEKLRFPRLRRR